MATLDSKAEETMFLARSCAGKGCPVVVVDVSAKHGAANLEVFGSGVTAVPRSEVLAALPRDQQKPGEEIDALDRGLAVTHMASALTAWLAAAYAAGLVGCALGLGGSGNTVLVTQAMRASLPLGLPKIMLSTMAGGNVAPYVGVADICMMPSVVDIAGLNVVSKKVLANAAAMAVGCAVAQQRAPQHAAARTRPAVGMTMFGVTTTCCDMVRKRLRESLGIDVLAFHANGTGGKAMEALVKAGMLEGVLDLTTSEVVDHLNGGVLACGPDRLEAAIEKGIPLVLSVGGLDIINYGEQESIPRCHVESNRIFFRHNAHVTLMRTTVEEVREAVAFIVKKLNQASSPFSVLIPGKGASALDAEGMPFHSSEAMEAMKHEFSQGLQPGVGRTIKYVDAHINEPAFAAEVALEFERLWRERGSSGRSDEPALQQEGRNRETIAMASSTPLCNDARECDGGQRAACRQVVSRFRATVQAGGVIIGAGAGTGISALSEARGGADLIVIYNSGRFRMAGRGSLAGMLPFADANAVVVDMAAEVAPLLQVSGVPLLAGVCGTDPFRIMPEFLRSLPSKGFVGVQNFPTVGLFDGNFRKNLEETGMGYGKEVDMIAEAHRQGLVTTPYVFTPEEAAAMTAAGADVVVAHVGLTVGGNIGAGTSMSLEEAIVAVEAMAEAAHEVRPDVLVLCHGGPIAEPADAAEVLRRCCGKVVGFFGASSMERLPVETAIEGQVRKFKAMMVRKPLLG